MACCLGSKDLNKAATYLTKAGEKADPDRMLELGWLFLEENGDIEQGTSWLKKAADMGHAKARRDLEKILHP